MFRSIRNLSNYVRVSNVIFKKEDVKCIEPSAKYSPDVRTNLNYRPAIDINLNSETNKYHKVVFDDKKFKTYKEAVIEANLRIRDGRVNIVDYK